MHIRERFETNSYSRVVVNGEHLEPLLLKKTLLTEELDAKSYQMGK